MGVFVRATSLRAVEETRSGRIGRGKKQGNWARGNKGGEEEEEEINDRDGEAEDGGLRRRMERAREREKEMAGRRKQECCKIGREVGQGAREGVMVAAKLLHIV